MTVDELRRALEAFNAQEFADFEKKFGGGLGSVQGYVDDFVFNPQHERRLCQLLGLRTEAEKLTDAALRSADASASSAASARLAMIWAGLGVGLSLVALWLAAR